MVLRHRKLIGYAEGSILQPTPSYPPNTLSPPPPGVSPTNATTIQDWEDKNLEAQIQIYMTLEHEDLNLGLQILVFPVLDAQIQIYMTLEHEVASLVSEKITAS